MSQKKKILGLIMKIFISVILRREVKMPKWEVLDIPVGTVLKDFYEEGVRVLVVRGPASLCAYIGIPKNHPLAGFCSDDIPLSCHGGLTYSGEGIKGSPGGHYWYGWDYAHLGDACVYQYDKETGAYVYDYQGEKDKKWTVDEVVEEARWVAWDFVKLAKLAEAIHKTK